MVASVFDKHKASDILFFIEEQGGNTFLLSNKEFHDKMESNRIVDGTRVARIQLAEKFEVITKKELKKINGDPEENSQVKKD